LVIDENARGAAPAWERFPRTRYLGSKRKLLPALHAVFSGLEFDTALDPFCGTGCVAYLLKVMGKRVTAGDALESNVVSARALVANDGEILGDRLEALLRDLPAPGPPPGMVERVFDEIFFERDENRFIDQVRARIDGLHGFGRDLALHALFQACLAKRPYNLFHRANLSMRRRDVCRSFGNKATWDRPFPEHMRAIAREADTAVFDSGSPCEARAGDALAMEPGAFDLVYLDPPYVSARGAGVDYLDFYHFLEGLCRPEGWEARILHRYRHKPSRGRGESPWSDPGRIAGVFEEAISRFAGSRLVVSYRSDGVPSIEDIAGWMRRAGKVVRVIDAGTYVYALSRNRRSREIIVTGE
jgi:adenine-specific DNA methylase